MTIAGTHSQGLRYARERATGSQFDIAKLQCRCPKFFGKKKICPRCDGPTGAVTRGSQALSQPSELAIHADDDSDDVDALEVRSPHDDRRHVLVRRLEPNPVTFREVALHGRLALDHRDDDLARTRGRGLLHEDVIAVEDPVFNHRFADDPQAEYLAVATDQH